MYNIILYYVHIYINIILYLTRSYIILCIILDVILYIILFVILCIIIYNIAFSSLFSRPYSPLLVLHRLFDWAQQYLSRLNFEPSETTKSIVVPILGNASWDTTLEFGLCLSNVRGALSCAWLAAIARAAGGVPLCMLSSNHRCWPPSLRSLLCAPQLPQISIFSLRVTMVCFLSPSLCLLLIRAFASRSFLLVQSRFFEDRPDTHFAPTKSSRLCFAT